MHTSIIIAAHNEGTSLPNTIRSCVDTCAELDHEIIIADDASTDGSVDQAISHFPQIRVTRHDRRLGASPTKHLGARAARGDTLVFLDAHCKPEMDGLCRLVEGVELASGKAIITPEIPTLDVDSWRNCSHQVGCGYSLRLKTFESNWLPLNKLRPSPPVEGNFMNRRH